MPTIAGLLASFLGIVVYKILIAIIGAGILAGCSIRPLPQDVTAPKYDTYGIVKRVRCEMRDAITRYAIRSLLRRNLAKEAEEAAKPGGMAWLNAHRAQLPQDMQAVLNRYDGAMVTYDFTFDITENNNVIGGVSFGRVFSRNTLGIGIAGESLRERHNTRTFRSSDNFQKLTVNVTDQFCSEPSNDPRRPTWSTQELRQATDFIYPITGSLNLFEMVGAFLDLYQSNNLTGKDKDPPALSDNVQFDTKWSGGINPSFEISPLGRNLELSKAGFTATGIREDKHSVIIVLTLPPEDDPPKSARATAAQQSTAQTLIERQRAIKFENSVSSIARDIRVLGF